MIGWYLGIDQSFAGFAVAAYSPTEPKPELWRKSFPAAKFGSGVDRTMLVGSWLSIVLRDIGIDHITHVAMEGYARGSKFRREEAGELSYEVRRTLHRHLFLNPVRYPTIVAPTSLKKYATSKGNADKKAVMAAIERRWRVVIKNDNEADAYVLARIAKDIHVGNRGIRRVWHEQEVLDELTPHTQALKVGQIGYSYMQVA